MSDQPTLPPRDRNAQAAFRSRLLMPLRRTRLIAGPTVAAVALCGCGLQARAATGPVSVTVTRDYGEAPVAAATVARPPVGATALDLLARRFKVAAGPGRSVRSINGLTAGPGERWRLYVNGVSSRPSTRVHTGDRLWWDLGESRVAPFAVVGSFPEPFRHGLGGKRLPTTIECAGDVAAACRDVATVLRHEGVPASSQLLGAASGEDSLTIVVGTWRDISRELAATLLARGPASSGVYAHFGSGGDSLKLLDARAGVVRTLKPPAGVIAALARRGAPPTWLVVGTDPAGVSAAVRALSATRLHNHFALAVGGARGFPVPLIESP
jgi:hypothetical protein